MDDSQYPTPWQMVLMGLSALLFMAVMLGVSLAFVAGISTCQNALVRFLARLFGRNKPDDTNDRP